MTTQFERLMRAARCGRRQVRLSHTGPASLRGEFEIVELLMVSILFRPSHRWETYTGSLRGALKSNEKLLSRHLLLPTRES
jgi:hypothetical protein